MSLSDNSTSNTSAGAFASLGNISTIENLDIDLHDSRMGDGMAWSLAAAIEQAHTIKEVKLSLEMGFIGDDGARALSTLRFIPRVRCSDLSLRWNQVGPVGKQALLGDEQLKVVGQSRTVKVWVP